MNHDLRDPCPLCGETACDCQEEVLRVCPCCHRYAVRDGDTACDACDAQAEAAMQDCNDPLPWTAGGQWGF